MVQRQLNPSASTSARAHERLQARDPIFDAKASISLHRRHEPTVNTNGLRSNVWLLAAMGWKTRTSSARSADGQRNGAANGRVHRRTSSVRSPSDPDLVQGVELATVVIERRSKIRSLRSRSPNVANIMSILKREVVGRTQPQLNS
jgi:hypothetical protein